MSSQRRFRDLTDLRAGIKNQFLSILVAVGLIVMEGSSDTSRQIGKKDRLALIISSLAFVASAVSVVINFITNERDEFYRELIFTPRLQDALDTSEMSFGFQNKGPGIAEIKRMVLWDDIKCTDSAKVEDWRHAQLHFFSNVTLDYRTLLENLLPKDVAYKNDIYIAINGSVSDIGGLVKDGVTNNFVKMTVKPTYSDEYMKEKFNIDFQRAKRHAFMQLVSKRNFIIEYCSLSGYTCKTMDFRKGDIAKSQRIC